MNKAPYTRLICKDACSFYKPGKKELRCGGYIFLSRHFTLKELKTMPAAKPLGAVLVAGYAYLKHEEIERLLCGACDFRVDGCDFAETCSGPPCGGYRIAHRLRSSLADTA
ncbi:MAG: hypothetical protein FD164_2293 [Nitrospirae bacterium]|nr:MAG: hypothetical protein FD164_2293 [Nitrospirota bacterium]